MVHVAFVTYAEKPGLTHSEHLTRDILEQNSAKASGVVWNDPDVDWDQFDIVILRSTWDYHKHVDAFLHWLSALEVKDSNLWNHPNMVRWNMRKNYLEELNANGIPIPRSHFIPQGSDAKLAEVVAADWPGAVLKPVVSASADDTYKFEVTEAQHYQDHFERILTGKDAIVQEFMPEVQNEGEWALMFIDNRFSHAVLKRPREGDFRVQIQHGGGQASAEPPAALIEQAAAILEQVPDPPLYARIDGVNRDGTFILMELELVEPYLYLEYSEGAPARFAEAILAKC